MLRLTILLLLVLAALLFAHPLGDGNEMLEFANAVKPASDMVYAEKREIPMPDTLFVKLQKRAVAMGAKGGSKGGKGGSKGGKGGSKGDKGGSKGGKGGGGKGGGKKG